MDDTATQMTKKELLEGVSMRLCRLLDSTGYSYHMIHVRRLARRLMDDVYNARSGSERTLTVGSKGEGMTKSCESDEDMIHFVSDVLCIEGQRSGLIVPEDTTLLKIVYTYPGYCILEQGTWARSVNKTLYTSMVMFDGKSLLSSSVYRREVNVFKDHKSFVESSLTGPASSRVDKLGGLHDYVFALSSDCHSILQQWFKRTRKYDWPPISLQEKVSTMTGNHVATGKDKSATQHLEWRLCFNEIELMFVGALNATQLKLYRMLKMINSDILKKTNYGVTSYIMKNIVFWLAELHPQSLFRPESLFRWIIVALKMLKRSVKMNYLPYYMIPDRNLLSEKVKQSHRKPLQRHLAGLIKSGPRILLQCEKVSQVLHLIPSELASLRYKFDQYESADLCCMLLYYILRRKGVPHNDICSDTIYLQLNEVLETSPKSGWPSYIQRKIDNCPTMGEVVTLLLS